MKNSLTWSEQDDIRLEALTKTINDYESGATVKTIDRLNKIVLERLPRAIQKIKSASTILSAHKAQEIANLETSQAAAEKVYNLSITAIEKTEPLSGAYSDPWKELFNAAKEFSISHAYTESDFPKTDGESLCVFCMQPLDGHAKDRLIRFNQFMQDKSKENYEQACKTLKSKIDEVSSLTLPEPETYEPLCGDLSEILGSDFELTQVFQILKSRKEYFKPNGNQGKNYNQQNICAEEIEKQITDKIKGKLKELQASITPEQHEANLKDHKKKKNKKLLSHASESIVTYIENLQHNKKVEIAINSLRQTKTRFSGKAKFIISQLVTPEFIANFQQELDALGVKLDITIAPIVRDSDTSHSFSIGSQKPGRVLSEGEQKVVSLAAYLAEIRTFANLHPIVFDDPVSSLDHIYREKIAARLCQEALARQVIIFTHDLALIMEVEGKCTQMALEDNIRPAVSSFTVRRNGTDSGFCHIEAPWRGMSTGNRAQNLEQELNSFKGLYETDITAYNQRSAMLYCLLREAWEAAIEQDLFFDIVSRGRNSVQTTRIGQIAIEPTDAPRITANMTLASSWMYGHDKSKSLNENRPSPAEIKAHIDALRSFANDIAARRKVAEKSFKAITQPPITPYG
ncbi:AAA family ATPase [Ectopseudomonas khazarica]|uniref:AAA family ATPase n=1 Tax=Ectopseudomonas khazarica TaxID=2502979 RepID=A0ABW7M8L4_9GAMM